MHQFSVVSYLQKFYILKASTFLFLNTSLINYLSCDFDENCKKLVNNQKIILPNSINQVLFQLFLKCDRNLWGLRAKMKVPKT